MTRRVGPQMTVVLDDRVRLGAREVNGFGDMLTELLCGEGGSRGGRIFQS